MQHIYSGVYNNHENSRVLIKSRYNHNLTMAMEFFSTFDWSVSLLTGISITKTKPTNSRKFIVLDLYRGSWATESAYFKGCSFYQMKLKQNETKVTWYVLNSHTL